MYSETKENGAIGAMARFKLARISLSRNIAQSYTVKVGGCQIHRLLNTRCHFVAIVEQDL
jgi:hypothetical protein